MHTQALTRKPLSRLILFHTERLTGCECAHITPSEFLSATWPTMTRGSDVCSWEALSLSAGTDFVSCFLVRAVRHYGSCITEGHVVVGLECPFLDTHSNVQGMEILW